MADVEIHMPHLLITVIDHGDFLGGLYEVDRARPTAEHHESGHARRPAARSCGKGEFSGEYVLVVASHPLFHPGHQDRIRDVRNPKRRLTDRVVADVRVRFVEGDGPGTA